MPFASASIANTNTTVLTVPQGRLYEVTLIAMACYGGSTETLTVYTVPSGGSPGNSNTLIKSASLATLAVDSYDSPLQLSAGDSIVAIGTTGSLVCVQVHYTVVQ
jgi:hypothetical protein